MIRWKSGIILIFFAESMYNLQFHLLFNLFNFIRLPSSFDFLNTSSVSSY